MLLFRAKLSLIWSIALCAEEEGGLGGRGLHTRSLNRLTSETFEGCRVQGVWQPRCTSTTMLPVAAHAF